MKYTLITLLALTAQISLAGTCSLKGSGQLCSWYVSGYETVPTGDSTTTYTRTGSGTWTSTTSRETTTAPVYSCAPYYDLILTVDGEDYFQSSQGTEVFKEAEKAFENGVCDQSFPADCSIVPNGNNQAIMNVAGLGAVEIERPTKQESLQHGRKLIALLGLKDLCR